VGIVRINGPRAIYDNNERIKSHSFNTMEKREIAALSASAAAPSASLLRRVLLLLSRVL
jgi:hypothetical protein